MKEKKNITPPHDLLEQIENKAAQPADAPTQEVRPLRRAERPPRVPYSTKLDRALLKRAKHYAVETNRHENEVIEAALLAYLEAGGG